MKYTKTLFCAAFILLVHLSAAAVEVTDPGSSGPGTLKDIVEAVATDGDTIIFNNSIGNISLASSVTVSKEGLSIVGSDGYVLNAPIAQIIGDALADFDAADLDDAVTLLLQSIDGARPTPAIGGAPAGVPYFDIANDGARFQALVVENGDYTTVFGDVSTGDVVNAAGSADSSLDNSRTMTGGAISASGQAIAELDGMLFSDNVSAAINGTVATGSATTEHVVVGGNAEAIADSSADASVTMRGGAVSADSIESVASSVFQRNAALAIGGTALSGNAEAKSDASTTSTIESTARATTSAYAEAHAAGGAIYASSALGRVEDSIFVDNTAKATIGTSVSGDAVANSIATLSGSNNLTIETLSVAATANSSSHSASGGAISAGSIESLTNSILRGNVAEVGGGNVSTGTATAQYGLVFSAASYDAVFRIGANTSVVNSVTSLGGAVYAINTDEIRGSAFLDNSVVSGGVVINTGDANSGSGGYSDINTSIRGSGGALYSPIIGLLSESIFSGNSIALTGATATSGLVISEGQMNRSVKETALTTIFSELNADGGAVRTTTIDEINDSVFYNNSATTTGGTVTAGAASATATGTASGATADASASSTAQVIIYSNGGAVSATTIQDSQRNVYANNLAEAIGGTAIAGNAVSTATAVTAGNATASADASAVATAHARGGAVYSGSMVSDSDLFTGNTARATGGTATKGTISGNAATRVDYENGNAYAMGGAVHLDNLDGSVFTDAMFLGNTAEAKTVMAGAVAVAAGGAIFVNTSSGTADDSPGRLTIAASAGNSAVFRGNKTVANNVEKANSLYFGRNGSDADSLFGDSANDAGLVIDSALGGIVELYDPIAVDMNNDKRFSMTKIGAGTFLWGGTNIFDAAGTGGSHIVLNNGTTNALDNLTVATGGSNGLHVTLGADHVLNIGLTRDTDLAIFDFTNASDKSFTVEAGSQLGIDPSRAIIDVRDSYLLVAGMDETVDDGFTLNSTDDYRLALDNSAYGELWLDVNIDSPYDFRGCKNVMSSRTALHYLVNDANAGITDAKLDMILADISSTNPEYGVSVGLVSLGLQRKISDMASYHAFADARPYESAAAASGSASPMIAASQEYLEWQPNTVQFWAGYVGSFSRIDFHKCYYGYKNTTNGVLLGANYVFSSNLKAGVYGGYTHSKTKFKGMRAEVTSDNGHFGAVMRYRQGDFAMTLDAGYSFYSNDGERKVGRYVNTSDFTQHTVDAGLGIDYAFRLGSSVKLSPFAGIKYTRLWQDSFKERGELTSAHLGRLTGTSVTSSFGATAELEMQETRASKISARLSAGWDHEFADRQLDTHAYYLNTAPIAFKVKSVERDRDLFRLGTDVMMRFRNCNGNDWAVRAGYNISVGRHSLDHFVSAGLELVF